MNQCRALAMRFTNKMSYMHGTLWWYGVPNATCEYLHLFTELDQSTEYKSDMHAGVALLFVSWDDEDESKEPYSCVYKLYCNKGCAIYHSGLLCIRVAPRER